VLRVRRKIATTLDDALYRRAQEHARREGRPFNALLEQALRQYLATSGRRRSVVRESAGVMRVPFSVVREALEADLYGEAD